VSPSMEFYAVPLLQPLVATLRLVCAVITTSVGFGQYEGSPSSN
jgi:hypothetical protein